MATSTDPEMAREIAVILYTYREELSHRLAKRVINAVRAWDERQEVKERVHARLRDGRPSAPASNTCIECGGRGCMHCHGGVI